MKESERGIHEHFSFLLSEPFTVEQGFFFFLTALTSSSLANHEPAGIVERGKEKAKEEGKGTRQRDKTSGVTDELWQETHHLRGRGVEQERKVSGENHVC